MEYLGNSRQKITKTQQTDKKGGFVRMGLAEGRWKFTFTKEGFKTYGMEMELSIGGFSETPDIVLTHGASSAAAALSKPCTPEGLLVKPGRDVIAVRKYRVGSDGL